MRKEDIDRFKKFTDKLQGKEPKGDFHYMTLCPAHGDANVSLWVKMDDNGKIHLECKAGCNYADVCEKMGFTVRILYPVPQIIDVFEYITLDGQLLYQEVKYDKTAQKPFVVRRPNLKKNPKEPWIWDKGEVDLILYNLHEVSNAKKDEIIFMNEGAKDARTLLRLGLTATAALFNNWRDTDTKLLDDKSVVIMVDNDDAGEVKALQAAHDRRKDEKGKGSNSIKLLRLPGLGQGEDVTDWLEKSGTKERLLELASSKDLKEWFPKESIRQCIKNQVMTGMSFEHQFPRPIFLEWLDTFHPTEEGQLYFYDEEWLKGDAEVKIYREILKNYLLEQMEQLLLYCNNSKARDADEEFKPTPQLREMILKNGETLRDLNIKKNPTVPFRRPAFLAKEHKDYKMEDTIIMKSCNFYVPKRLCFPRNMDAWIAMSCLPFDYDPKAKCPEIEKALNVQWKNDEESKELFLEFLYYIIKNSHIYKTILFLVGVTNSGKSKFLELIQEFIGRDSCEAISLGKLGKQFELYRCRNAKLLVSDDVNITRKDLQEGALIENTLSIPAGAAIRIERKNGEIYSRILPGQLIMAGNNPPEIASPSRALAERFKFLTFTYEFILGKDMDVNIVESWKKELPGLMNLVLDAGLKLDERGGFIESKSSKIIRERFEGGSSPVRSFVRRLFDVNLPADPIKWFVRLGDMKTYYLKDCDDEGLSPLPVGQFTKAMEAIAGIRKDGMNIKMPNDKGKTVSKWVRGWIGIRRKNTSGHPNDEIGKTGEF